MYNMSFEFPNSSISALFPYVFDLSVTASGSNTIYIW